MQLYVGKITDKTGNQEQARYFHCFSREILLLLLALHAICGTQSHSNMLDRHHAVFIAGFTRNLQYAEPLRHAE
jgi:hypothetical protein